MNRRTFVEFIIAWVIVFMGVIMICLPLLEFTNIKIIFGLFMLIYGIIHFIKSITTIVAKDYSGFEVAIACVVPLILMLFLDINDSPWNLALVLFIWVIIMSLIKLKESDYYHDRKNKLWKLNIINLILFIISGILATLNLYYTSDVQILVLGFFLLINGILELMDPLCAYLLEEK